MEHTIFWKTFEETGKVLDYLRYKYEEDVSDIHTDTYKDIYHVICNDGYNTETLRTSEEEKWEIQLH